MRVTYHLSAGQDAVIFAVTRLESTGHMSSSFLVTSQGGSGVFRKLKISHGVFDMPSIGSLTPDTQADRLDVHNGGWRD